MSDFLFPQWTNRLKDLGGVLGAGGGLYAVVIVWLGFAPKTITVGYEPEQPIPYSHKLHAGELGIDCRYCHTTVDKAAFAAIPPTQTCMNCHANIRTASPKLAPLREAHAAGMPVEWRTVHDLPDYAYFDHSAHVNKGVGCVECHGRVDTMEVVGIVSELSMGWCLDCHRDPAPRLRPLDKITDLAWVPDEDRRTLGERLIEEYDVNPKVSCSTCHR